MALVRWTVIAVLFLALVYLSLQNTQTARLTFFNVAAWEAPLILIVFVAFACGVAAGLLAGALRTARLKRQVNKLRRDQRTGSDIALTPSPSPARGRGEME